MNQWRKQFEEHPLHKELDAVNTLLAGASIKTKDPAILDSFNRLVIVLRTFTAFVTSLNAECTVKGFLDNLNAPLSQLHPQLDQFLKNENASHLQKANNQADQLVQRMPPFALPETAAKQTEAVASLATAVENLIASITDQSKTTSESLRKLNEDAKATDDHQRQLDKTIEAQKARLDAAIAEFQKQFSETEAGRRKQIEATEQNFKTQFDQFKEKSTGEIKTLIDAQKKNMVDLSSRLDDSGKKIIAEMESKKDAAAKVLDVSSNVAVSGGYGKYAAQEKFAAEVLRIIALVFMCSLIYGAYRTIEVALYVAAIDWKLFAIRGITTFTLAIPAFYAVRESNKHRITEHRYRKMQLELAAIDPYLELMEKDKREQIKVKLSERFFAQPEITDATTDVDAGSLLDIIKQVITTLLKK
jgi:exonuclease VII large subunit